ncbi:MAG TPA: HAMP domain-containing sensor histidine kinase [Solirubrobacteraceae bacterium]|nr:HAMP domain-containing sensor histidine kinase [Solirubrobacteraceae bacterium]
MSLRRRIAAAAAVAVAAVAVAVALTGYFTTRAHLLGEVKSELRLRAQAFLAPHGHDDHRGNRAGGPPSPGPDEQFQLPTGPLGGAQGVFQVVDASGSVLFPRPAQLPVGQQVLAVARHRSGSVFYDTRVGSRQSHVEVYAAWDAPDQHVVMVALSLSDDDDVLHGLLLPYLLLIAGGIILATLLGLAISRSALRPIERFVARTERVTRELDRPARLEEVDTIELRRLASSFNQTLDALERSIEAQRHLVADASHELRTPIAALRSNIQIFLEAERLPLAERQELQQSILAELDELTQIVADVMELAQGAAPELHPEPVELDTIVRESVDRTQRRAPSLRFNLDLEPTVVLGVPERIGRAVSNVIDNARRWSPPEGEIDVRLHDGVVTVRDHGPGFGEADLPHVFDRFYRAKEARRMPGSGLGLAIVKQAAESHGGRAEAANAPDGGALLTVSFGARVGGRERSSVTAQ